MATFEAVCDAFARQARYCDEHGSPFTARLLRGLTQVMREGEPALQAVASWHGEPMLDALPLRVAGALHALVLEGCAPELTRHYPGGGEGLDETALSRVAVAALKAYPQVLADYLASPPQTNEVGRAAVLVGGFMTIAAHTQLPLRTLELGASAGLNLRWNGYRYRFGDSVIGEVSSPLELTPAWHGDLPPPAWPVVATSAACDQFPVDISDAAQRQRLRSYVWADQSLRLQQLDAALSAACRQPPLVEQVDAAAWIERQLHESLPEGVATVVYHTIFWTYLNADAQERIARAICTAGRVATAAAPLAWLRFEIGDFRNHPRLLLSVWPGPQDIHLADAQAHGNEIFWHGAAVDELLRTAPRHGAPATSLTIDHFGESP
ncbi:DUF2332 domain-containing protein [Dyella mobilis]|uniref:DUF2332 family protein n=1 Tax=Dyella mobilis TaxID=1849582 RepID=A0ABS2KMQ5_9GAMM|nr:DUF2332 family protein [Dyella mobilis]MBM7131708.1 DUF2332 family protein [Dyella mobilis]GLQ96316.1 hypothetical protein GCM10007863_07340 [Dyella mobilis]